MSPLSDAFAAILDPSARADPYPVYRALRESGPVHINETGLWIFTDHATCSAVLRDVRLSADYEHRTRRFRAGPLASIPPAAAFLIDPPDHTRIRGLVSQAFTPRMVEQLRPGIQQLVDELLDELEKQEAVDLIADFAYPLPVTVGADMLGVPVEEPSEFRRRTQDAAAMLEPIRSAEMIERAEESSAWFFEFFRGLIPERRAHPRDDLLSALVADEDAGDKLTETELITTCIGLLIAAHETTRNLIGNGMLALLRHPDQLDLLRRQPDLIKSAVEELLRYDTAIQLTSRVATEAVAIGDVSIAPEEHALALIGAANRDPAAFPDPERLDITRQDNHHLSFSTGAHYCLGASLARVEGQVAIETLVRRYPDIRLADGEVRWRDSVTLRGLHALPLQLKPTGSILA